MFIAISALVGVDVVCDIRMLPFRDETFDAVLSKHVIEHFSWREVAIVLHEWVRVLRRGGVFRIQCPNLAYLCEFYAQWFRGEMSKDKVVWFGPESDIFGGQTDVFDYHKTGFSYETLSSELAQAGIGHVSDLSAIDGKHNRQYQLYLEGIKE